MALDRSAGGNGSSGASDREGAIPANLSSITATPRASIGVSMIPPRRGSWRGTPYRMGGRMFRFAVFVFATLPLNAQWLHLPTPGIPRTADGKPNLTAPTPRTAEGKPDLSGLWGRASDKYYNN